MDGQTRMDRQINRWDHFAPKKSFRALIFSKKCKCRQIFFLIVCRHKSGFFARVYLRYFLQFMQTANFEQLKQNTMNSEKYIMRKLRVQKKNEILLFTRLALSGKKFKRCVQCVPKVVILFTGTQKIYSKGKVYSNK